MARYSTSAVKTSAAAAGWVFQLRQPSASRDVRLFEVGLFSTSAAAGTYGLVRSASVGAATFTSVTGAADDPQTSVGSAVIDTAAGTAPSPASTTAFLRTAAFPATAGAGVIWTFPTGIVIPAAGGLMIYQTTAAAVGLTMYAAWDE